MPRVHDTHEWPIQVHNQGTDTSLTTSDGALNESARVVGVAWRLGWDLGERFALLKDSIALAVSRFVLGLIISLAVC